MKKLITIAAFAATFAGCASSIKTTHSVYDKDTGKKIADGTTSVSGWSDKVFESSMAGGFVDNDPKAYGSGFKEASAKVEGSGFAETFKGLGDMMGGMAHLMAVMQTGGLAGGGVAAGTQERTAAAAWTATLECEDGECYDIPMSSAKSHTGTAATSSPEGTGVYGRASCPKCKAYLAANPGTAMLDLGNAANRAAMWKALKARGHTGSSVTLPVIVTENGYVTGAK